MPYTKTDILSQTKIVADKHLILVQVNADLQSAQQQLQVIQSTIAVQDAEAAIAAAQVTS